MIVCCVALVSILFFFFFFFFSSRRRHTRLQGDWSSDVCSSDLMTMLVPGHAERFYLAPFGLLWSEVKASDLLELDFGGTVVAGRGLVEDTALYIHLSVHRLMPQARCVLHTHMPHATALSRFEDPRLDMAAQNG